MRLRPHNERRDRALSIALPIIVLAFSLGIWELVVRAADIPPYVLPAPSLILQTLFADRALLLQSLLVTLITTFEGSCWRQLAASDSRYCSTNHGWSNIRFIPSLSCFKSRRSSQLRRCC